MDIMTLALAKKYTNQKFAEMLGFGGFEIVQELPTTDISYNTIYLLRIVNTNSEVDLYKEYIYTSENKWEPIGITIETGATFTPQISKEGILSWTNDKGLTNPEPINIMGPQGVSGVYVGSGDMPADYNVQIDIDGEPYEYVLTEKKQAEIVAEVLASLEQAEDMSV